MTPEIESAFSLLKAKMKAIGQTCDDHHRDHYLVSLPSALDRVERPTLAQLRDFDTTELEHRLRCAVPKEQQIEIRAGLVADFGRSTVGELFEVVAKRILERGAVASAEEFQTVEPFVWTHALYGQKALGEADHRRLCALLEDHRQR